MTFFLTIALFSVVNAALCWGMFMFGYSKGRLFQIDKMTGVMSKADAHAILKALEKLCEYTETAAGLKPAAPKTAVTH